VGIGADGWNYGAVGPLEAILKQGRGLVVWGFDLGARAGGGRREGGKRYIWGKCCVIT